MIKVTNSVKGKKQKEREAKLGKEAKVKTTKTDNANKDGGEIVLLDLVAEFEGNKDLAKDYNAERLRLLVEHYKLDEYTNAGNAKKALAELVIEAK